MPGKQIHIPSSPFQKQLHPTFASVQGFPHYVSLLLHSPHLHVVPLLLPMTLNGLILQPADSNCLLWFLLYAAYSEPTQIKNEET